jgi:ABC-type amino acid transport substrate-binding protein/chorismate mutase
VSRAFFAIFGLFCAFPSAVAWALSSEDIRSRGELRVGMSGDYAPFCVCQGLTDTCAGFDVEVAHRLANDLGVTLKIVLFHWPELRQDLQGEKFDLVMSGITMRPERLLFADFTRPYAIAGAVVLVMDKKRFPSANAVNQRDVRLAVNAGGHLEQVARMRFTAATIVTTSKNMELPVLVAKKQVDAILTDSFEAPHFLSQYPSLSALPSFGRDRKVYMVRRADGELREWINTWLLEHERNGFLSGLRRQWFGQKKPASVPPLNFLFSLLDLRLALMPAIADYKHRYSLPIEDGKQEASVLEHVAEAARLRRKNPEAIQTLFRVQIELAKEVQQFMLSKPEQIPKWARGFSLAADLRPVLSDLGDRILECLFQVSHVSLAHNSLVQMAEEEIVTEGVSVAGKRRLGEAVWRVITGQVR